MSDEGPLIREYEELALLWDGERNSRKANRIFDKLHKLDQALRTSEGGRSSVESLLSHGNRGVRLKAASACLAWDSASAIAGLEDLVDPRGFHSLEAEMTLRDAGFKERIDFGDSIGTYVSRDGTSSPTSIGILHYRADGSVHIIPGRPQ
jgi:hypothetical protein